ncbi:unnamed protein product [Pleuronectes platessa]|uniref:Uncharacterized protein n=1 Tax=Pleuronectes platessa TaxID=8262 RepID=A0A9N7ULH3_PLEPL|nr:unnamed protein product [Pleuronectes platessa]
MWCHPPVHIHFTQPSIGIVGHTACVRGLGWLTRTEFLLRVCSGTEMDICGWLQIDDAPTRQQMRFCPQIQFAPQKPKTHFVLPHFTEPPACLFFSSHLCTCALHCAPQYKTDGKK